MLQVCYVYCLPLTNCGCLVSALSRQHPGTDGPSFCRRASLPRESWDGCVCTAACFENGQQLSSSMYHPQLPGRPSTPHAYLPPPPRCTASPNSAAPACPWLQGGISADLEQLLQHHAAAAAAAAGLGPTSEDGSGQLPGLGGSIGPGPGSGPGRAPSFPIITKIESLELPGGPDPMGPTLMHDITPETLQRAVGGPGAAAAQASGALQSGCRERRGGGGARDWPALALAAARLTITAAAAQRSSGCCCNDQSAF